MRGQGRAKDGERGATLLEFAVAASVYFLLLFSITSGAVVFWTHNGLVEATRRGARHAATVSKTGSKTAIRNMAVHGNTSGTGQAIVPNLVPANIAVRHSSTFGVNKGTVSVAVCTVASDDEDGDCTPYTYTYDFM